MIPKRKIEIRQARKTDLDRIVEIEKLSFSSEAWDRKLFLDYLLGCPGLFLVAKRAAGLLGTPSPVGHGLERSLCRLRLIRHSGSTEWGPR